MTPRTSGQKLRRMRNDRRNNAARGGRRPELETLESRTLLSIMVDTFDDVIDAGDGLISLREAITQAASTGDADTIELPAGSYALTFGTELLINDPALTIQAVGGDATIDGLGATRVFAIEAGSEVTMQGLVITGGAAPDPATGAGGGINNLGTVTIEDCVFLNNFAGFIGGGLHNSGTATINDTLFQGNSSTYGGGLNNDGNATIVGGSFLNNSVIGNGGAIDNIGTLSVDGTLFEGNRRRVRHGVRLLRRRYRRVWRICRLSGHDQPLEQLLPG